MKRTRFVAGPAEPVFMDEFRNARMAGTDSPSHARVLAAADRVRLVALAHTAVANFLDPTHPPQTLGRDTINRILRERHTNTWYRRGQPIHVVNIWPLEPDFPELFLVPPNNDDAQESPLIARLGLQAWVFALADALTTAGFLVYTQDNYHIAGIAP